MIVWTMADAAALPDDDRWLSDGERAVLAGLAVSRRRADWRLGRWAAKRALAARLGCAPEDLEVIADADGAPAAWAGGARAPAVVSLSHRAGRAFAVAAGPGTAVGCDLERIEPRSDAFVALWLAPAEQAVVRKAPAGRAVEANLIWSAKEAAAKARREGLRLDVRGATVIAEPARRGAWGAVRVSWADGAAAAEGWWRASDGFVATVVCSPPAAMAPDGA